LRDLPVVRPDEAPDPVVLDLLERITGADVVVFSTPEYAAGTRDVEESASMDGRRRRAVREAVAWRRRHPGRGAGARTQLRVGLTYVGSRIVDDACVHIAVVNASDTPRRYRWRQPCTFASAIDALRAVTLMDLTT